MKKKNILYMALSLVLVAVVAVGGTLAYFSDTTDVMENTFTTGEVSISIIDRTDPGEGQVGGTPIMMDDIFMGIAYGTETPVMPGDELSKIVGVELNDNSQPAYLALKLSIDVDLPGPPPEATPRVMRSALTEEQAIAAIQALIDDEVDSSLWVKGDDNIYYCQVIASTDAQAEMLFTKLQIPFEEWGNEYAGINFRISAEAAGLQAANVADAAEAQPLLAALFV